MYSDQTLPDLNEKLLSNRLRKIQSCIAHRQTQHENNPICTLNEELTRKLMSFSGIFLSSIGFDFEKIHLVVKCRYCRCQYRIWQMEFYADEVLNTWHRSFDPYCPVLERIKNLYGGQLRTISATPSLPYPENLGHISLKETRMKSFAVFNRLGLQEIVSTQEANRLAEGGLFYDVNKNEIKCTTCQVTLYRCVADMWFQPTGTHHAQCSHVGLLQDSNLLTYLTGKMRPHAKKMDLVNLRIPEMWINVFLDFGFKMDTMLMVVLYKKYLYPNQINLFTNIKELMHWIFSKQKEAELQFQKFWNRWPIHSRPIGQNAHSENEHEAFVIVEETQCKIFFSCRRSSAEAM